MAIEKACSLCVLNPSLFGQMIEIVSDSRSAVSWINGDGIGSLKYVNTIYNCREHIRLHGGLSVSFKSRSSNTFADSLAKLGSSAAGDFIK